MQVKFGDLSREYAELQGEINAADLQNPPETMSQMIAA